VHLEEQRPRNQRKRGLHRWVETLELADLRDPAGALGNADEFISLVE
jgi:hypothetical protein